MSKTLQLSGDPKQLRALIKKITGWTDAELDARLREEAGK